MDDGTSPKFEIKWEIQIGDMVRLKRYDTNAYGYFDYGIVTTEKELNQTFMFPSVDIFVFRTKSIEKIQAGLLEVISHAQQ